MTRKAFIVLLLVLLAVLIGANASYAGNGDMKRGIGLRAGYGIDPDQFIIGGQAIWGALKGKVDFSPSLDFGFGDHATVTTINFDGTLNLISAPGAKMKFYIGGGPTVAIINPEFGDGDTEIGLSLLGGIKIGAGEKNFYNISARIGIGDIPDFKFLFGYMFGLGSKGK